MSADENQIATQTPPEATEHHLNLKPFEGTFKSEVKLWLEPGDPMVSTGMMTSTFQLNGLYLHQDYVGDPTSGPFSSFEGKGYWGYNTLHGIYEGFWIDNASTMMQIEYGSVDETGKIWEMHSEIALPDKTLKKRSVITLLDHDRHQVEAFYVGADGQEMKNMELSYVRA